MVIIPVIMVLIMVIIMVIIMIIIVIIMVIIMLNNFCFHVNAQKCQVVGLSGCQVVKLSSSIPWDSGHAEQIFVSMSMLKPNCL